MSYFDDGATVPPPFNLFPTPKSMCSVFCSKNESEAVKVTNRSLTALFFIKHLNLNE
jgi:hypothetical protein